MRTPRFARISAVVAASAVAATLGLTACSNNGDGGSSAAGGSGDDSGRGPIVFAMGKNDTDKIKPIIDAWNADHPDETVSLKELSGEADAQRDTLVQILQNKGSDVDVMALDVVWTAEFASHHWVEPLEGDLAIDTSGLLQSTVDSATYGGKLYALPQNTNGQLLFRNTELAPTAPRTWDELAKSCDSLTTPDADCLILQLKQYEGLTVNSAGFIEGWGGHIVDSDGATPVVDSDKAKEGLQAMVDAYNDGVISKDSTAATEEQTALAFTEGKVAYAVNWPYMYDLAGKDDAATKGHFEVSPLVARDGVGVSTLGGYNNGINPYSKHKATARDFMEFIISDDNQKSFAEQSFPPVVAAIYDDPELIAKYPYLPALKESLENAVPRPVSPFYPAISKAIQDNVYGALTKGTSVDDATAQMKTAIEQAAS